MKRSTLKVTVLVAVAAAIFGCGIFLGCASTIPFNNGIRADIGEDRTTEFQYYISDSILLSRENRKHGADVVDGQAVISSSRQLDEIVIACNTLGRVIDWSMEVNEDDDSRSRVVLKVGFEQLADGTIPVLLFSPGYRSSDDDKYYKYYLLFDDWKDRTLEYGNSMYVATFLKGRMIGTTEERPFLKIKIRENHRDNKNRRRVKGLSIAH